MSSFISRFAILNTVFPSFDTCSIILSSVNPTFKASSGIVPCFFTVILVSVSSIDRVIGSFLTITISQLSSLFIFSLVDICLISLFRLIETVLYTLSPLLIFPYILPIVTICPVLPSFILLFPIISSDILHVPSFMLMLSPKLNSFVSFTFA